MYMYVHKPVAKFFRHPEKNSQNVDGFRQNNSQGY